MARAQDSEPTNQIGATLKLHINVFLSNPLVTIRQGSEKVFSKLKVACALAWIVRSKAGYTAVQSQKKTVVMLFVSSVYLSLFLFLSLSLFMLRLLNPPSLSLSLSLSLLLSLSLSLSVKVVTVALCYSISLCLSVSL